MSAARGGVREGGGEGAPGREGENAEEAQCDGGLEGADQEEALVGASADPLACGREGAGGPVVEASFWRAGWLAHVQTGAVARLSGLVGLHE